MYSVLPLFCAHSDEPKRRTRINQRTEHGKKEHHRIFQASLVHTPPLFYLRSGLLAPSIKYLRFVTFVPSSSLTRSFVV